MIAATPLSCTGDPGILAGLCDGDANLCNCWYSCWSAWIPGPGGPEPSDALRTGEYLSVETWVLGSLYESLLPTKSNKKNIYYLNIININYIFIHMYNYVNKDIQ